MILIITLNYQNMKAKKTTDFYWAIFSSKTLETISKVLIIATVVYFIAQIIISVIQKA